MVIRASRFTTGTVTVLLRLAYLAVANTFAVLRLLLASDRDRDTEISRWRNVPA